MFRKAFCADLARRCGWYRLRVQRIGARLRRAAFLPCNPRHR